ncbi:MAG: hypothetical protein ACE5HV_08390 [Acidobacteriota bacterium]
MNGAFRLLAGGLVLVVLAAPGPARAQESGGQKERGTVGEFPWYVSGFGGRVSSGTSLATVANPFFNTTFKTGDDSAFGVRVGRRVYWRVSVEGEFTTNASPGLNAVLANLNGGARVSVPFAKLDLSFFSGSVRFDLAERLIRPFLLVGVAGVRAQIDDSRNETALGVLFGGGVEVSVPGYERVFVRTDVRGLRADISALGLPASALAGEEDEFSTQVIWTVGAGFRF